MFHTMPVNVLLIFTTHLIIFSGGSQGGHSSGSGTSRSESTSSRPSGSSTAGSFSSSSSTSGSSGQVDVTFLLSRNQCKNCSMNGESFIGGRHFKYLSGCIEHLCSCYCSGTYYCAPEKSINLCELDKSRTTNTKPKGCAIGNRTHKTGLFSYEINGNKHYCCCYDDGSYFCDSNKTRKVC